MGVIGTAGDALRIKRFEFCPGVAFTHPEFNTSLTQEIEGRHTLSDTGRTVGYKLGNAMLERNVFRPLGRCTKETSGVGECEYCSRK